jgi:trehalose 2-sulfotransferase
MIPQSYLICATQRTGSTLLCGALRESRRIGNPQEYFEYLNETGLPRQPSQYFTSCEESGWNTARVIKLLGSPKLRMDLDGITYRHRHGYRDYVSQVLSHGKTSNGIFGAKIMWDHLPDLLDRLTGNADLSSSQRVNACLQSIFPSLKYIYVTRQDKLRQAISLWKAIQTQQWRLDRCTSDAKEWRVPVFDFEAIDYLQRRLVAHERDWQRFFTTAYIEPLVLRYEEFANDLKPTFIRVAEFLGLKDRLGNHFAPPSMIKQSNLQSEGWIKQYGSVLESKSCQRDDNYLGL